MSILTLYSGKKQIKSNLTQKKKKTSLSWQPFNETTGRKKVDQAKLREAYQQDCLDKWKGYF